MSFEFSLSKKLFSRHAGRMLFLAFCVALGVAFLAGIDNLLAAFRGSVSDKARELLAADLSVSSNRPFTAQAREAFAELEKRGARSTPVIEFASMLRQDTEEGNAFLVSVKVVEPAYPLYGKFETLPTEAAKNLGAGGILIEDSIALQHSVEVGQRIRLGAASLLVEGILTAEPDRAVTSFNLAPRVVIRRKTLDRTGLLRFGSRIRYRRLFALPDSENPRSAANVEAKGLEERLNDPFLTIRPFAQSQPTLRRGLTNVSTYFVLVAVIALLLGGVGMGAGLSAFLDEQLETAAVLRCLGLSEAEIRKIYVGLCLAVGALGGILGLGGGWLLSKGATNFLAAFLGLSIEVSPGLSAGTVVEAFVLSLGVAGAASWRQVSALSAVSPLDVFRERRRGLSMSRGKGLVLLAGVVFAVLGYTYLKSGAWRLSAGFTVSLLGAGALSMAMIAVFLRFAESVVSCLSSPRLFSVRHGLLQLVRRRASTVVFLFTLSFGFSLLGALEVVRGSLEDRLKVTQGLEIPDLFLVDIQKGQKAEVEAVMNRYARTAPKFAPLVRARMTSINGVSVDRVDFSRLPPEKRRGKYFLVREQNLTFKDVLQPSEKVLKGEFWKPGETLPQVSMEKSFAEDTGISMGDRLVFDIQGRPLEATVTSLRDIEWESARPNFFMVFPEAVLSRAPHYFVASFGIRDLERSIQFQRELVKRFPNVSVIDIAKVLDKVEEVLGVLLSALGALAWFCVAVGLIVLAGMVAVGRRERRDQTALLRALGLDKLAVVKVDAVEFLAIGAFSSAIAASVAMGLGWALAWRIDVPFSPDWARFFKTIVPALVLPAAVGLAANWRSYGAGVLDNLRRET